MATGSYLTPNYSRSQSHIRGSEYQSGYNFVRVFCYCSKTSSYPVIDHTVSLSSVPHPFSNDAFVHISQIRLQGIGTIHVNRQNNIRRQPSKCPVLCIASSGGIGALFVQSLELEYLQMQFRSIQIVPWCAGFM
ncbi:hypothetical protein TNCV_4406101 [Trichonephila clavipes]|nr:hypothetical protein TNCV_4406101 [Trichonephila clavipes]